MAAVVTMKDVIKPLLNIEADNWRSQSCTLTAVASTLNPASPDVQLLYLWNHWSVG